MKNSDSKKIVIKNKEKKSRKKEIKEKTKFSQKI